MLNICGLSMSIFFGAPFAIFIISNQLCLSLLSIEMMLYIVYTIQNIY